MQLLEFRSLGIWLLFRSRCCRVLMVIALLDAAAIPAQEQRAKDGELTISEAVELAVAQNSSYEKARLETKQAVADLAAYRTKRYLSTSISAQGAGLLTEPEITFATGSLGNFAATGPIPANNQTIKIPRDIVGIVSATASQPLTTLHRLNLQLKGMSLGVEGDREDERKQRLNTIDQTRRAYYEVVKAQSALDSQNASLPYYKESQRVAAAKRSQETTFQSDLLTANAQLLQAENSVSDAEDQLSTSMEKLNDLMGRDIHIHFRVSGTDFLELPMEPREALETRALQNRPDVRKARLDVKRAEFDVRAKRAEYIPEISAAVSYYTTFNFGTTLPSNIAFGGLSLSWEPWDWGRKRQEARSKKAVEDEAKVSVSSTERSALLEVSSAFRQMQNARRQLTLAEANLLTARQRLHEIQEQTKQEEKLNKDLFKAQSDLASADDNHAKALAGFWQALADLKKSIGEE